MEKIKDRFFLKVNKTSTCWLWKGTPDKDGYGRFAIDHHKEMRAHRFSYTLFKGDIPSGMFVCHECDNPSCVNPDHLWLGDALSNNRDARKKGRSINVTGENHGCAKLSWRQIGEIRRKSMENRKEMAKKYGVSRRAIDLILSNETWKV